MRKKTPKEYWITDSDTYNRIQKLKRFVDFVSGLPYSTPEQKTKAEEIKLLIDNIDKPETFLKEWCVCLNIFDIEVQAGNGTGIYWRGWRVYLEMGRLEIESFYHVLDENRLTDDYFPFYGIINFEKETTYDRIWGDTDFDEFIADAMNYESYVTESLNEIEVEIDLWNRDRQQREHENKTPKPYKVSINFDIDKFVEKYLDKKNLDGKK